MVPRNAYLQHQKIIAALKILDTSIYDVIADTAKMEKNQVGRRLKELEEMGLVYKPGTLKKTKGNRLAYEYKLTDIGREVVIGKENMPVSSTEQNIKKAKEKYQPENNPLFKF